MAVCCMSPPPHSIACLSKAVLSNKAMKDQRRVNVDVLFIFFCYLKFSVTFWLVIRQQNYLSRFWEKITVNVKKKKSVKPH